MWRGKSCSGRRLGCLLGRREIVLTARLWADADALATAALRGYVQAWPHLVTLDGAGSVVRASPKSNDRVALVIGNGLGHEPAMAGLIGEGLLDVNVPGRLFEAPSSTKIRKALELADRPAGVLLCVSNHSGDVLNAEMALERHQPSQGPARMVVLGDDVASAPLERQAERRGTAGLLFAWKILGAAAEAGLDLEGCVALADRIRRGTRTLSAALGSATHPITGASLVEIAEDQAVIGTGVHGEAAGMTLEAPSAEELVTALTDPLIDEFDIVEGHRVALLVNDAGGLAPTERAALSALISDRLRARGLDVVRTWFGQYATTFDLRGLAVSLLSLDDELLELYDAPCEGAAFASLGRGAVG